MARPVAVEAVGASRGARRPLRDISGGRITLAGLAILARPKGLEPLTNGLEAVAKVLLTRCRHRGAMCHVSSDLSGNVAEAYSAMPPRFLCPACWRVFPSGSLRICGVCSSPAPRGGWPTLPYPFRDRFIFVELLGRGGMGSVFKAEVRGTRDYVAVKVAQRRGSRALDQGITDTDITVMFEREAGLAAHLNADKEYFVGVREVSFVDPPYIALEFVPWPTLRKLRKAQGPLPPENVAWLGVRLLRGVRCLEERGIVHRDLKPDNIFAHLRDDGRAYDVKIGDLGVYADAGPTDTLRAAPTALRVFRTPQYTSPEELRNEALTSASDVHMVGSVLWELLTGSRPYDESDVLERLAALRHLPNRPAEMPPELYAILTRALSFDPADRAQFDGAEMGGREPSAARGMEKALEGFALECAAGRERERAEAIGRSASLTSTLDGIVERLDPARKLATRAGELADQVPTVETLPHSGASTAALREHILMMEEAVTDLQEQVDEWFEAPLREPRRQAALAEEARRDAETAQHDAEEARGCAETARQNAEKGERDAKAQQEAATAQRDADKAQQGIVLRLTAERHVRSLIRCTAASAVGAAVIGVCIGVLIRRPPPPVIVIANATPTADTGSTAAESTMPAPSVSETASAHDPAAPSASTIASTATSAAKPRARGGAKVQPPPPSASATAPAPSSSPPSKKNKFNY